MGSVIIVELNTAGKQIPILGTSNHELHIWLLENLGDQFPVAEVDARQSGWAEIIDFGPVMRIYYVFSKADANKAMLFKLTWA